MTSPSVPAPVPDWRPGPVRPCTLPAVVDIWRIRSTGSMRVRTLVNANVERGRARAAMTAILGAYLGLTTKDLVIQRPARGKPFLASPATDLHFNLSHTRGMALVAVARGIDIGIDVEVERDVPNRLAMARRVFPPAIVERLARLDGDGQNHAFLSAWTAMEARQKAFGRGIFEARVADRDVRALEFSPAPGWLAHIAVASAVDGVEFRYFDHTGP